PDPRNLTAAFGAAVNGDKFTDAVAGADARLGALALILQILRSYTHGRVWIKNIFLADPGWSFGVDVGHKAGAGADFDRFTDDAIRADIGGWGHARLFVERGGVGEGGGRVGAAPRLRLFFPPV